MSLSGNCSNSDQGCFKRNASVSIIATSNPQWFSKRITDILVIIIFPNIEIATELGNREDEGTKMEQIPLSLMRYHMGSSWATTKICCRATPATKVAESNQLRSISLYAELDVTMINCLFPFQTSSMEFNSWIQLEWWRMLIKLTALGWGKWNPSDMNSRALLNGGGAGFGFVVEIAHLVWFLQQ